MKVVLFDWGGVVESHENNNHELNSAKIRMIKRVKNNISDDEIISKWTYKIKNEYISIYNDLEHINDWINQINKNFDINLSYDEFKQLYIEEFSKINYYKDVVAFAHSLKNRCKIGILSNLTIFDKPRIDMQFDLSKFDYVYLSFELGIRKDNKNIYEYIIKELGIVPNDILFIDDEIQNIKLAKECGINTCLASGYELNKIKKGVYEFLNLNK